MLGAVTAKRIESAPLNKRFNDSFIAYAEVDTTAEIKQALKRSFLSLAKNGLYGLCSYIFDGS